MSQPHSVYDGGGGGADLPALNIGSSHGGGGGGGGAEEGGLSPEPVASPDAPAPSLIVGTLTLTSKVRYGMTSRHVPMYLFQPYARALPPMRVACSLGDRSKNVVALVLPAALDTTPLPGAEVATTLPRGVLTRVLGPSGDPGAEQEALVWAACPIARYPEPGAPGGEWVAAAAAAAAARVASQEREGLCQPLDGWSCLFNIDDATTRDVDDVVGVRRGTGGEWEFVVVIADVASAVPQGDTLDAYARSLGCTLYSAGGGALRPMLPAAISEGACSLLPGERRLGLGLFFEWAGAAGVRGARLARVVLTNKHSFTYENVRADAPAHGWVEEITALEGVAAALGAQLGITDRSLGADPHTWIEALMLFYNVHAGERLRAAGDGRGLLRAHAAPERGRLDGLVAVDPSLKFLGYAAAQYVPADAPDSAHWGLHAAAYAHASSPLRRYSDLHNQRLLMFGAAAGEGTVSELAAILNARTSAVKGYERDSFFLSRIEPNKLTTVKAVFLRLKEAGEGDEDGGGAEGPADAGFQRRRAELWVKDWGRVVRLWVNVVSADAVGVRILSKDETSEYVVRGGQEVTLKCYADLRSKAWLKNILFTMQP
jgi:hypothetical protein